jgi:hypothetical protein
VGISRGRCQGGEEETDKFSEKKTGDLVREIRAWVMLKYYTLRNMSVLHISMTLALDKKRGIDELCCRLQQGRKKL